eukprot:jgi/Botrbrau1/22034/Bobra.0024s0047.1
MRTGGSSEGRTFNLRPRSKRKDPDYEELASEELSTEHLRESGDEAEDVTEDSGRQQLSPSLGPIGRGRGAPSGVEGAQVQKKKVGRPIAFQGDVNAPHLTEAERRRLRRREANRESARRVRMKRQAVLEEVQVKVNLLQEQNQRLRGHLEEVEGHKRTLMHQMSLLRDKWAAAAAENFKLQSELSSLRRTLEVQHTHLQLLQLGASGPSREARSSGRENQHMGRQPSFGLSFFRSSSLDLGPPPLLQPDGLANQPSHALSHLLRRDSFSLHNVPDYLGPGPSFSGLYDPGGNATGPGPMPSAFAAPIAQQGGSMHDRAPSGYLWGGANLGDGTPAPGGGRANGDLREDTGLLSRLADAADAVATPTDSRAHSPARGSEL